ncbi:VOC family protein [Actinomycetospora sp. OC33-EN08]|uniref:VOC family protein n=1 Tax=Actinomycetospora aurantiaca TaxID=3129233 RepID=A0ABU8MG42_9PSEU
MTIELNHTIVLSRDQRAAARELAELLGVEATRMYHFNVVSVGGVSLDFMDVSALPAQPLHYAFLVGEDEFDAIFGRIRERGLAYWAGPGHSGPQQTNRMNGGRGVYWDSVDGHAMEILTRAE